MKRLFAALILFTAFLALAKGEPTEAADQKPPPPKEIDVLLGPYCDALGQGNWDGYRQLFHINGHPDFHLRDFWKEHRMRVKFIKSELLFKDKDTAMVRLHTEPTILDYKPPVTIFEISILIFRKEGEAWKIWEVSQIDSGKKE